jgi:aminoglycoside phosphotransferase (APT) family kinase protein
MKATSLNELKRIAEGREAEIFAWEPGVVLKLYRSTEWLRSRDIESAAMEAVKQVGGATPAALGFVEVDGRPGLLIERIEGIDMLTAIGRKPWKIIRAGGIIGGVHAALNSTAAPSSLQSLKERLSRRIADVGAVRADLGERGMRALAPLPDGDRLCHGDFHPGNVILSPTGPVVIDWPGATRGDATADVARTVLMIRLGDLPPGAPLLIRKLDKVGRTFLRLRYLAAYRKVHAIDTTMLERWTVPVAIARLAEGIEPEIPKILKLLGEDDQRS